MWFRTNDLTVVEVGSGLVIEAVPDSETMLIDDHDVGWEEEDKETQYVLQSHYVVFGEESDLSVDKVMKVIHIFNLSCSGANNLINDISAKVGAIDLRGYQRVEDTMSWNERSTKFLDSRVNWSVTSEAMDKDDPQ